MKLTIAIPTYCRPDLVILAIESSLNQTKAAYEILVHDNSEGSETERALLKFPKELVRYHRHSTNIGIAGNWNSLVMAASGDYVKFLNDDDQLHPDCLATAANALKKHSAGVITCRANYVTDDGTVIKADKRNSSGRNYFVAGNDSARMWLKGALPLRTPTHSFYRTDIAKQIGGFTVSQDYTRDVFFALRMAVAGGAIFLEENALASFLLHPGQDGKKIPFRVRVDDQCEVKRWAFEHCDEALPKNELEVELHCVALREMLLMLKNRRWGDALQGGSEILHSPQQLGIASWRLLKRETLTNRPSTEFERCKEYFD